MAYQTRQMASYNIENRVVYDGDELYIQTWLPYGDNDSIADRLSKPTFSQSAKLYPRQSPSGPGRPIKIVSTNPPFREVSKSELDSITDRLCKPTFAALLRSSSNPSEPREEECSFEKRYSPRQPKSILKRTPPKNKPSAKHSPQAKPRVVIRTDQFEYSSDESYESDETDEDETDGDGAAESEKGEGGGNDYEADFEPDNDEQAETDGDRTPTPTRGVRRDSATSEDSRVTSIPGSESTLSLTTTGSEGDEEEDLVTTPKDSPRDIMDEDPKDIAEEERKERTRRPSVASHHSTVSSLSLTESEVSDDKESRPPSSQSRQSKESHVSSNISYKMADAARKTPSVHSNASFKRADSRESVASKEFYNDWAKGRTVLPGHSPRPSVGSLLSLTMKKERPSSTSKEQPDNSVGVRKAGSGSSVTGSRSAQSLGSAEWARSSSPKRSQSQKSINSESSFVSRSSTGSKGREVAVSGSQTSLASVSPSQRVGTNAGSRPTSTQSQQNRRRSLSPARSAQNPTKSQSPRHSITSRQSIESIPRRSASSRTSSNSEISQEPTPRQPHARSKESLNAFSNSHLHRSTRSLQSRESLDGANEGNSSRRPSVQSRSSQGAKHDKENNSRPGSRQSTQSRRSGPPSTSSHSSVTSRGSASDGSTNSRKKQKKGEFLRYIMDEYKE